MFSFSSPPLCKREVVELLRNLPEVRGFQLLLLARFSSSLHPGAGRSRRSFRPSNNRAMTAHLADADSRDHSSVSAYQAWLRSPVASKENFPSTKRAMRQGRSRVFPPRFSTRSTSCET